MTVSILFQLLVALYWNPTITFIHFSCLSPCLILFICTSLFPSYVREMWKKGRKQRNREKRNQKRQFHCTVYSNGICIGIIMSDLSQGRGYLHLLHLWFVFSVVSSLELWIVLVHVHFVLMRGNKIKDMNRIKYKIKDIAFCSWFNANSGLRLWEKCNSI